MSILRIADRHIGAGHPTYIVAELSGNHHQSFNEAVDLIRAAAVAGANAIKIQTVRPDQITLRSAREEFRVGGGTLWDGRTLYDLYTEVQTPWEWHDPLKTVATESGLHLFSSPFDLGAVDFLESLGMPAYKVASFELVDLALVERIAKTGKPVIMSTGMATLSEISDAVDTVRMAGNEQVALLKCTSAYPAPPAAMNLRTIPHLAEAFRMPVGLSDHTLGMAAPIAAVALGACVIEKHLTLSRDTPGPDSAFSLEPQEFKAMVEAVRAAEQALGKVCYGVSSEEEKSRVFRRSLFVVEDVKAGELFTERNVRSIRPGYGLAPKFLQDVLGRRATRDLSRGTPISWQFVG